MGVIRFAVLFQVGLIGIILVQTVSANEYDYTFFSDIEYTDNIRQSASINNQGQDSESGRIYTGGLSFLWENTESRSVAASIDGRYARRAYSSEDLEDENLKDLVASFLYDPQSNNFSLSILNSLRQVEADRTSVQTVNNTRDINIFTVSPRYHINLSRVSRWDFRYEYTNLNDERDAASREIETVGTGYRRRINRSINWSLNVSESTTDYNNTDIEYEIQSAFFRLQKNTGLTTYIVDLGLQKFADAGEWDQPLIRLSLLREINSYSDVDISYQRGYSNAVNVDLDNAVVEISGNNQAGIFDGLVIEEQVNIGYQRTRRNLRTSVDIFGRDIESDEEFGQQGNVFDETRYGGSVTANYRFSPGVNQSLNYGITFNYRYEKEVFHLTELENNISTTSLRFNYFANDKFNIYFQLRSRNTSGTGNQSDTDEKSALLGFEFSPTGGS